MAGHGPHYSVPFPSPDHRNSSFALATIRPDGFVAVVARDGVYGRGVTSERTAAGPGPRV